MIETVSIQKIGNRYGVVLPDKHLDRVGWKEADVIEIRSDAKHIEFVEAFATAKRDDDSLTAGATMRNYYAALRQLAKS
jgi:bifunctional DNA-binding transcriptional regulator/antitoxin component of YhaV-PrlF toxin-antitoxin module